MNALSFWVGLALVSVVGVGAQPAPAVETPAAAKSQNESAPCLCSVIATERVLVPMPVTLLAAEKLPIFSGRSWCA
jgi:hypothetical protein